MKIFLLFLFFTGIVLIIANQLVNCNKTKVKIEYVQRDLDLLMREEAATIPGDFITPSNNPGVVQEFKEDTWLAQQGGFQGSKTQLNGSIAKTS